MKCEWCETEHERKGRFCSDRCYQKWWKVNHPGYHAEVSRKRRKDRKYRKDVRVRQIELMKTPEHREKINRQRRVRRAMRKYLSENGMKISELVKQMRKKQKLTQKQLAEKLKVSEVTVQRWEYGDREPRGENLRFFLDHLETSQ